jgi:hypothetical protein
LPAARRDNAPDGRHPPASHDAGPPASKRCTILIPVDSGRASTAPTYRPMLLVKTYLNKSRIHGLGVFAGETIRKGTKMWRFVFGFDRYFTRKQLAKLPKQARDYIRLHGYQWKNEILLSMDYDTFMNHSINPNTYYQDGYVIARCNIRKGAEITNDYRAFEAAFCAAFLKKKTRPARKRR